MRLVRCQVQTAYGGGTGQDGAAISSLCPERGALLWHMVATCRLRAQSDWVKLCVGSIELNVCVCFSQFQMGEEISVPMYVIMNILWGKNGQVSLVWSGMGKAGLKTELLSNCLRKSVLTYCIKLLV